MKQDLSDYRKSYEKSELSEENCLDNPIAMFQKWFYEAEKSNTIDEVNTMTLSTIGLDGFPKSRIVLLKKYTNDGFVFYTNYDSEKGKAIEAYSKVCLSFFWSALERQVIIKGTIEKITANESDDYFESRPRGSQLGALVSNQSEVITSRKVMEANLQKLEEKFKGKKIPRPTHWGGYIVKPVEIEFWQGRANRLHDRMRYQLQGDYSWKRERLAP